MWECAIQKHEAQKVAIMKAFIFLASKMKHAELKYLFEKIKSTSLTNTDKFLMHLLKTIARSISQQLGLKHKV